MASQPKLNLRLSGAYGIVRAPAAAMIAHPERVRRFMNFQRALWAIRIGAILGVLALLTATHVISL
jgi:hypothetical protein